MKDESGKAKTKENGQRSTSKSGTPAFWAREDPGTPSLPVQHPSDAAPDGSTGRRTAAPAPSGLSRFGRIQSDIRIFRDAGVLYFKVERWTFN